MALNFTSATACASTPFFGNSLPRNKDIIKLSAVLLSPSSGPYLRSAAAQSEGSEARFTAQEEKQDSASPDAGSSSSVRAQLGLLEQLTSASGYESDAASPNQGTIREQLARLVGGRDDDFSIPLGKNLKKVSPKFLTTSQKRNIKRQTYLNEVSQRNDSVFFATIGAFVLLPPVVILGIAILTGYVQLFP